MGAAGAVVLDAVVVGVVVFGVVVFGVVVFGVVVFGVVVFGVVVAVRVGRVVAGVGGAVTAAGSAVADVGASVATGTVVAGASATVLVGSGPAVEVDAVAGVVFGVAPLPELLPQATRRAAEQVKATRSFMCPNIRTGVRESEAPELDLGHPVVGTLAQHQRCTRAGGGDVLAQVATVDLAPDELCGRHCLVVTEV